MQLNLFDGQDLTTPVIARARNTDPETSHQAAAQVERSGKAAMRRSMLASYVKEHPGLTNGEIADALPEIGYQETTRRMGEVEKLGLIRRGEPRVCSVHGTKQATWWPN